MIAIRCGYAASPYGQLHYRIVIPEKPVSASPLLCLHQTPSSSKDWIPVMPALGQNRVVVAVDTPGYGMSDAPPEPGRIEDFAAIMVQFMADLTEVGIVPKGRFDAMGFHTGSLIATEIAKAFPDNIAHLVLFGLAAFSANDRAEKLARLRDGFPIPDHSLHHVEKIWGFINEFFDPRIGAEERHVHMAECLRIGTRIPWGYISVFNYDFLGTLATIDTPTLVFNPEDDLWAVTREVSHLIRNGIRYDIPGVSHGVLTIERDLVVGEIEKFLA